LNILAVEDDSAVAQFLALLLGGENCKVATACNGEKALAKIGAAHRPFDVVITDHRMPRMSGLELVRELRVRKFGGKVVVLSAYLTESNTQAYEELGVDMMISKPFDVDELRRTIDVLANAEPNASGASRNCCITPDQTESARPGSRPGSQGNGLSRGASAHNGDHPRGRSKRSGAAKESTAGKANGQH
jgi:CheY-like chemotaxis protein